MNIEAIGSDVQRKFVAAIENRARVFVWPALGDND